MKLTRNNMILMIGICSVCLLTGSLTFAIPLPLNNLDHGRIVGSQFSHLGVSISGFTYDTNAMDTVVIFDSRKRGTEDADLENSWSGGNIQNKTVGNLFILPEENRTVTTDRYGQLVTNPNDEGNRTAGYFRFDFTDYSITSFGFDLIDVENVETNGGFFAAFYDDWGNMIGTVTFADFLDPNSPFYDPTIAFGNNTANRISAITAEQLGVTAFNRVEIGLGGSGGISGVNFTSVPEPSTLLLLGTGIVGFTGMRRKKKEPDGKTIHAVDR